MPDLPSTSGESDGLARPHARHAAMAHDLGRTRSTSRPGPEWRRSRRGTGRPRRLRRQSLRPCWRFQPPISATYARASLRLPPGLGVPWGCPGPALTRVTSSVGPAPPRMQRRQALRMLLLCRQATPTRSDAPAAPPRPAHRLSPKVLTGDRSPLDPTRTASSTARSDPGSNCIAGCLFDLCPYPPKGAQSYRNELSEAFCRRQQALVGRYSILSRSARWQGAPAADLRRFWRQMGQPI